MTPTPTEDIEVAAQTYAGLISTVLSAAEENTPMTLSAMKLPYSAVLAIVAAAARHDLSIALAGPSAARLADAAAALKASTGSRLKIAGTCALETAAPAEALEQPATGATLDAFAEAKPAILLAALRANETSELTAALRQRGCSPVVVCLGGDRNLVASDAARALDRRFAKPRSWIAAVRSLLM